MHLGLDLGTSGLKALIMDDQQQVIAVKTVPLAVSRPHPGWSEQHPADWIEACIQVFDQLQDYLPHVQSVGIAGHMHGVVMLDAKGDVLRPCMLWNDTRATEQALALDSDPIFQQISGTIVFPGFSAPKLLWVKEHEPQVWSALQTVLFPKDYLAYWLTGQMHAEPSDAAGSALFDCAGICWSAPLCRAAGIPITTLPALVASDGVRGKIQADHVSRYGFLPDTVIAGGAGDNAGASIGIGAVQDGQGQVSLGTSGVLLTVNERWTPDAKTAVHSFNHAVAQSYIQMGVTLTATDSLSWFADLLGEEPSVLAEALPQLSDGPSDLLFLPYLAGERTPHNMGDAKGAFFGLGRQHGPRDLTQAVMEGVAFSIADCAQALTSAGASVERLVVVGGGAKSSFWVQTLADVLERPLILDPRAEHAAALGAARLGMASSSNLPVGTIVAQAETMTDAANIVEPRPSLFPFYRRAVARYRALFAAIKGV